jgi:hypothetical protein
MGILLLVIGWLGARRSVGPLRAAEQAYLRGDYLQALQLYQDEPATVMDPGLTAFNRAATLYQLGLVDLAAREFQAARSTGDTHRSARASYDLGNCALRLALRLPREEKDDLLHEAIDLYDSCMVQIGTQDQELLENAWHNQELARSLLADLETDQTQPSHLAGGDKSRASNPTECEH